MQIFNRTSNNKAKPTVRLLLAEVISDEAQGVFVLINNRQFLVRLGQ